jgi:hypothetical protein
MNTLLAWRISEVYVMASDLRRKGWIGISCPSCHGAGVCGDEECGQCEGECFSWEFPRPAPPIPCI